MLDWIEIVALYAFGAAFFRLIGGLGAASEALQSWGRASAERRRPRNPSSGAASSS
jgi:hypothetical protein